MLPNPFNVRFNVHARENVFIILREQSAEKRKIVILREFEHLDVNFDHLSCF